MRTKKVGVYLFDTRNPHVGLGEFEHHLAIGLSQRARELREKHGIELYFILPSSPVHHYGSDVKYIRLSKLKAKIARIKMPSFLFHCLIPKVDLLHLTQQLPYIKNVASPYCLLTVHDINYLHNGISQCKINIRDRKMKVMFSKATHLSFITNFTKNDVLSHFSLNIPFRVIVNGTTNQAEVSGSPIRNLPKAYDLVLSGFDPKKNVDKIIAMMKYLPDRFLVVAGKGSKKQRELLEDVIRQNELKNVCILGCVSAEEKAYLYQNCQAFYFASRSEGFGLPIVEAMSCGKPVFSSPLTSLPEVGGDAVFYFKDFAPQSMASTVKEGLKEWNTNANEYALKAKKQASLYNWDKMVDEYIQYYLAILGGQQ